MGRALSPRVLPGPLSPRSEQNMEDTQCASPTFAVTQDTQQDSSAVSGHTHPRVGLLCADPGMASVACPVSERLGFRAPCTWPQQSLLVHLMDRHGVSQCCLGRARLGPGRVSVGAASGAGQECERWHLLVLPIQQPQPPYSVFVLCLVSASETWLSSRT